jgi:hypothetical protein
LKLINLSLYQGIFSLPGGFLLGEAEVPFHFLESYYHQFIKGPFGEQFATCIGDTIGVLNSDALITFNAMDGMIG